MNFISRIIKSINAMRERLKIERHEAMYGPHFNEECALKAVSKMENEDGSRGEHWSLEETTSIANQYGINLKGEKYNKYDWYVALNMIRSDYYRAVVTMTSSDHIKYFVELAKAWLNDKDIEEGKMWYYYCYIMCDKLRKEAKTMLMLEDDEDEEHEYRYANAGIDPGVAALLQNANKGNMDPAALMAMMNNGGFGGNGGWWWIWIILIFFCWGGFGGNGFGRGSDDASRLASQLNTDTNTSLLMQAIQGNKDAISSLSNTLNCDINAVQTALNTINTSVSQIACDTKLASCEVINAITSGNANLASQLANCCCQTQRSIDSVNLNLTQMSADNKLSICQQTNTLQNAITGGFNNLLTDNTNKFNVIGAKIDAQTQMINDKFCQLEMREMQNKIDTLRAEKSALELGLSQSAQTANIVNQLRPCPVPAYLTCNPFGCNGGFTGYGYGYNDGCGCGC